MSATEANCPNVAPAPGRYHLSAIAICRGFESVEENTYTLHSLSTQKELKALLAG
jgi:hypothetical protein